MQTDDRVGAERGRMLTERLESVPSGALTKIGVNTDVSADIGLQCRADVPDNAARPHDDSANQPDVPRTR